MEKTQSVATLTIGNNNVMTLKTGSQYEARSCVGLAFNPCVALLCVYAVHNIVMPHVNTTLNR